MGDDVDLPKPCPAFALALAGIVLAGCAGAGAGGPASTPKTATVDLDYASTSLGFRNSGALAPGRLMLWDVVANDLVVLEDAIPLPVTGATAPATLQATDVQGVDVQARGGGAFASVVSGEIKAAVSRDLVLQVEQASRESNQNARGAMSAAYAARQTEGADPFGGWRVADATQHPDRYRYVLLVNPVRAAKESIGFRASSGGSLAANVVGTAQGEIAVDFSGGASGSCAQSGADLPVCLFNVQVLQAFIQTNGNLDYTPVQFSREALSGAFRK